MGKGVSIELSVLDQVAGPIPRRAWPAPPPSAPPRAKCCRARTRRYPRARARSFVRSSEGTPVQLTRPRNALQDKTRRRMNLSTNIKEVGGAPRSPRPPFPSLPY